MSKDSSSGGLLSKVVKFVRHPATNWGDLDTVTDQRDQYSKQALKEMIERKRRNDFVRKREFDMLRRLRAKGGVPESGQRGRPSFFQSSFNSRPDDRAGTLKKIDEIEAQMSMQWWKTKQRDSSGNTVQNTRSAASTRLPPQDSIGTTLAYGSTLPLAGETEIQRDALLPPFSEPVAARDTQKKSGFDAPTQPMTVPGALPKRQVVLPPDLGVHLDAGPTQPPDLIETSGGESFGPSQFSASKFYAMDVAELALDPEIEEAAIRFASGDVKATEQGLLEVLSRKGAGGTPDEWLALLDLYRATGMADRFESQAIDFANRFSRSAPQWVSLPAEASARVAKPDAVSAQAQANWTAEADVDGHKVTIMARMLERVAPPWVLDWSDLQSIQPTAVIRLARMFSAWAESNLELRFVGSEQLLHVLAELTPSGQRKVDQTCWELRLAALRVMNLPDEFESTALDFCVTYEISPPAWEPPHGQFRDLSLEALGIAATVDQPASSVALSAREFVHSNPAELSGGAYFDPHGMGSLHFQTAPHGELFGELAGDPNPSLAALDRLMGDAAVRVVSCKYLIRVDFAAAGAILNWAAAHQAQGRRVRFVDVNRLISAFFHVIGITEQADVVPRED